MRCVTDTVAIPVAATVTITVTVTAALNYVCDGVLNDIISCDMIAHCSALYCSALRGSGWLCSLFIDHALRTSSSHYFFHFFFQDDAILVRRVVFMDVYL